MSNPIVFQMIKPHKSISEFVDCFWLLENNSNQDYEMVALTNASFDLCFIDKKDIIINFKILAAEYCLNYRFQIC